jgi:hypothetical protein
LDKLTNFVRDLTAAGKGSITRARFPWDKGLVALLRNVRKHDVRRLAREVHNTAACLSACRTAICKNVGLKAKALEDRGRHRPVDVRSIGIAIESESIRMFWRATMI